MNAYQVAIAKERLERILTTPCDSGGHSASTPEEDAWALNVWRTQPDWAKETLRALGLWRESTN